MRVRYCVNWVIYLLQLVSTFAMSVQENYESRPNTADSAKLSKDGSSSNQPFGVMIKTYVRHDNNSDMHSLDSAGSRSRKRQKEIIANSIAFINGDDMDDITEPGSVNSFKPNKQIVVSQKFAGKPLPGYIKLTPNAPRHETVLRNENVMKNSINDIAVINSKHTVAAGLIASSNNKSMALRRGASTTLVMDEVRRATSPVSGFREKIIFKDFVNHQGTIFKNLHLLIKNLY